MDVDLLSQIPSASPSSQGFSGRKGREQTCPDAGPSGLVVLPLTCGSTLLPL